MEHFQPQRRTVPLSPPPRVASELHQVLGELEVALYQANRPPGPAAYEMTERDEQVDDDDRSDGGAR
jgi:hypothetical protein